MKNSTSNSQLCALWRLLILLSLLAQASGSESTLDKEISQAQADDLHVLTHTIPGCTVSKMPATQALEQLWTKTSGKKAQSMNFAWISYHGDPEPTIDKFDMVRNPAATFNASNGKLVALVPKDDVAYVQAIARLANRGQLTPVRTH